MSWSHNLNACMILGAQYLTEEMEEDYVNPNEEKTVDCALRLLRIFDRLTQTRQYKYRQRGLYAKLLYKDYFADNPVYGPTDFHWRFRMRKSLILHIVEAVKNFNPYFQQRPDGLGKPGHDPLSKICVVFRMLCYGSSADSQDEHFRIGSTTVLESVSEFCNSIISIFGEEYTRYPTPYDIVRLMPDNVRRGFPGMIGSVDCMHWEWKNCPSAWQGQFVGHYHKPTIVLEAVSSYDTWFWHSFFGMPGSNNDINVLQRSPLFQQLHLGIAPPTDFTLNGHYYKYRYYLTDGIYPKYATIVQGFRHPSEQAKICFTAFQANARKDVERAFVEDERRDGAWTDGYDHTGRNAPPVVPDRNYRRYHGRRADAENEHVYNQLREDLVHYIWNMNGPVPVDG